mmetsp:Transcript_2859/g.8261  ORF Transcript_2859/g.8261 Transcript_2859/m.8261 type:complete len:271 (+) Transcript_2859:138-950(+)
MRLRLGPLVRAEVLPVRLRGRRVDALRARELRLERADLAAQGVPVRVVRRRHDAVVEVELVRRRPGRAQRADEDAAAGVAAYGAQAPRELARGGVGPRVAGLRALRAGALREEVLRGGRRRLPRRVDVARGGQRRRRRPAPRRRPRSGHRALRHELVIRLLPRHLPLRIHDLREHLDLLLQGRARPLPLSPLLAVHRLLDAANANALLYLALELAHARGEDALGCLDVLKLLARVLQGVQGEPGMANGLPEAVRLLHAPLNDRIQLGCAK